LKELKEIIHANNQYAFFVGAGISKNSELPTLKFEGAPKTSKEGKL